MGDSMPSEKPVFGAAFVYTTSGFMPTRVSCIDASLAFQARRDLLRKWRGRQPCPRIVLPRHPGAHLEACGALPVAYRYLVLHPEGLVLHLGHRGADPHLVAVAHRRGEARSRLDDRHAHDTIFRKDLRPRQPQRLEERLRRQVEPLEEARVEDYPRRVRLRPAHLHLDGVVNHLATGAQKWPPYSPILGHRLASMARRICSPPSPFLTQLGGPPYSPIFGHRLASMARRICSPPSPVVTQLGGPPYSPILRHRLASMARRR